MFKILIITSMGCISRGTKPGVLTQTKFPLTSVEVFFTGLQGWIWKEQWIDFIALIELDTFLVIISNHVYQ